MRYIDADKLKSEFDYKHDDFCSFGEMVDK